MQRILLFLIFFLILGGLVLASSDQDASAEELYKKKSYNAAIKEFEKQLQKDPKSARVYTNLACTMYQLGRKEEALQNWQMALENSSNPLQSSRINYNIGNYYFNDKQLDKAIESYKTALRLNPNDLAAKYNLEIAIKQKQPPPPNNPNSSSPNNNNDNNKDNDNPPPPENNKSETPKPNKSPQMSRDEAERLLEALQKNERGPARRVGSKEKDRSSSTPIGRDW